MTQQKCQLNSKLGHFLSFLCGVCVHALVFAWEGAHVCTCMYRTEDNVSCFPRSLSLYLLRQGSVSENQDLPSLVTQAS